MSFKFEIDSWNAPFMRHIGAAMVAIAREMDEDCASAPKDRCDCTPAPPATLTGMTVVADPTLTPDTIVIKSGVDSVTLMNVEPPPVVVPAPPVLTVCPPPGDDETGWPDPPTPAGTLDAAGIPWDARIHAGSKARMKADNTWKLKPGIDKALVEQVKAELLGVQAVPVPPAMVSVPANSPMQTVAEGFAAIAPPPVAAPPAPAAPSCPANFAELIKEVTTRITAGTMTADQVNAACVTVGLQMCNQLAARQDLIPSVWSVLCPIHA